ncbi:MAG: hypothetical protein GJT30_02215 [Geobacter sp.]|nr:hypothetical protein [Geobacter sp.]
MSFITRFSWNKLYVCLLIISSLLFSNIIYADNITKSDNYNNDLYEFVYFNNNYKKYETYPWELKKVNEFIMPYNKLASKYNFDKWATDMSGPGRRNRLIKIKSVEYILVRTCKQKECDTNNLLILFEPVNKEFCGLFINNSNKMHVGSICNDIIIATLENIAINDNK